MPLAPSWADIALRLFLTCLACGAIGLDRGVRGHAAGLRTTILVGLAASVAMIQANILLPVAGKTAESFGVMDLMRLPLGILTGVGFIGAGTILRRGDLVTGVTTAATLWMVTVIGLCFGGGQLGLGIAATLISVFVLTVLSWFDKRMPRKQRGILVVALAPSAAAIKSVVELVAPLGYAAQFFRQCRDDDSAQTHLFFEITWKNSEEAGPPLDLIETLVQHFTLVSFELAAELPQ
jgi:putative Mg2+ transporter-C (MgtC) family protein